jgi:hypothetical protein
VVAVGLSALLARISGYGWIAVDVFGGIEPLRAEAHVNSVDPEVPVVWTVLLSVHLLVVVAVTSRRLSAVWPAAARGWSSGRPRLSCGRCCA